MNNMLPPASLPSVSTPGGVKKKRVLLVDNSQAKRELSAKVVRKFGMDVDCAADVDEARSWWKADFYDCVLINMEKSREYRDKFCDDLRSATPPQRLALMVGRPEYLARSPNGDGESPQQNADDLIAGDMSLALAADHGDPTQHWGILEASRRISAVRSKSLARTQARRVLPDLPRDSEGRPSKRTPTATNLDDLLREELR
jgi:CheY-like chemotaxis protein